MTPFHLRDRLKKILGLRTELPTPRPFDEVPVPLTDVPTVIRAPATLVTAPAAVEPPPVVPAAPVPVAASAEPAPPSEADLAKQAKHWLRTRKGMLKWLVEQGGEATMADMHTKSEAKYFVAHRSFSRLMEEFTGEELVTYVDGRVALTEAGRAAV